MTATTDRKPPDVQLLQATKRHTLHKQLAQSTRAVSHMSRLPLDEIGTGLLPDISSAPHSCQADGLHRA